MELQTGTVFAGYRIEHRISSGALGAVHLARHPRLPRSVALKILLHGVGADSAFRARFAREADLVARLDHPNIVEIYDRGDENGHLWIAMRYVPGSDAAQLLDQGRTGLPPQRAVEIVAQAARGVDAAHRRGLLHRDVKPANLLVGTDDHGHDQVFVTDFGMARSAVDSEHRTETGAVEAAPAYVAPEQIRGGRLDHRVDIYALGCTLYHLLTGTVPFARSSVSQMLTAHLADPPPRPSHAVPGLPNALDEVIATALAKDPARRYRTCRELAEAANRALSSTASDHHMPGPTGPSGTHHNPGGVSFPGTHSAPGYPPKPVATQSNTDFSLGYRANDGPPQTYEPAYPDPALPAGRPARTRGSRGTTVALAVVVAALSVITLIALVLTRPFAGSGPAANPTTAAPSTTAGSTTTRGGPTTSPVPAITAWGRDNDLVALFPDLLPSEPDARGYRGARCESVTFSNNGQAPALHCAQDNGLEYFLWSFRPGDPRRDSTFTTNIDNDTTREETWHRPSGTGRFRASHDPGSNYGLLTIAFDDPARKWVVIDMSWGHHTGQEILDQWWADAPI